MCVCACLKESEVMRPELMVVKCHAVPSPSSPALPGAEVGPLLSKSGLDKVSLAQIW